MGIVTISLSLILALLATFLTMPYTFDNGQCTRACRDRFGSSPGYAPSNKDVGVYGVWTLAARVTQQDVCECFGPTGELGQTRRKYLQEELGFPYVWRDHRVCGVDGKVYDDKRTARRHGVEPLHCGTTCGACSTEYDISRYRDIGADVAPVVGPCIFAYMVFGELVDGWCMSQRARYREPCNKCWIQDHGCLVSHCFNDCVLGGGVHWKRLLALAGGDKPSTPSKELCIDCMERYCSKPFIVGCGTNRRTAGILTDIVRDEREHCDLK